MNKRCNLCGKDIKAKNYWQKYCSSECRLIAWAVKKMVTNNFFEGVNKSEVKLLKQKAKDLANKGGVK